MSTLFTRNLESNILSIHVIKLYRFCSYLTTWIIQTMFKNAHLSYFFTRNFLEQRPNSFERSIFDNFWVCRAVFLFHIREATTEKAIRNLKLIFLWNTQLKQLIQIYFLWNDQLKQIIKIFFWIVDVVHKNKTENCKSP